MSKILYITNYNDSEKVGYCISDYLNDLTFYGLKELYGDNIIDSTQIIHLYKENHDKIDHKRLFGILSGTWLLNKDTTDRSNIEEKIKDKYFDLIIYGSIRRCCDYWDIVSKTYPKDRIILIDGEDDTNVIDLHKDHLYFKRELITQNKHKNVKPISFSWPTKNLANPTSNNKIQKFGTVIPGEVETYIFDNQEEYYNDYKQSYFGLTTKKAGWDCMRHYEILGNYSLPFFPDLKDCPPDTLFNFPKELILESNTLVDNLDSSKYFSILDEVFKHTKKHLTTKAVAQYLINNI
tara:strand:+ start:13 stop:891 length:879 start_codon:yes stop_codon:yes gene_type:complete